MNGVGTCNQHIPTPNHTPEMEVSRHMAKTHSNRRGGWPKGQRRGTGQNAHVPVAARFWARVDKSGDCWLWTGSFDGVGYGKLIHQGARWGAHRMAYVLSKGPIPNGQWVLHRCDVRACVNPGHLFLGSVFDNNKDMHDKGRARGGSTPGDENPRSKMTMIIADEIRRLYALDRAPVHGSHKQGRYRLKDIAEIVRVSHAAVSNVVRGRNWVRR